MIRKNLITIDENHKIWELYVDQPFTVCEICKQPMVVPFYFCDVGKIAICHNCEMKTARCLFMRADEHEHFNIQRQVLNDSH